MTLRPSTSQNSTSVPAALSASTNTSSMASSQAPYANAPMSAELEQTLSMLSSHRSVLGYLLITRGHHPSIIRHSGVIFEGDQGKKYAAAVARIVESVKQGLDDVRVDDGLSSASSEADVDEVKFMRIRTKRHEIMISPDERYLLAVLHDPAT